MSAQIYTFKITYENCDNRIWRIVSVSSNYTFADLGYLVLATFETMGKHLFEMTLRNIFFFLDEDDLKGLAYDENTVYSLMRLYKIGKRRFALKIGDVIKMTYDFGCCQNFNIELLRISDLLKGSGPAYPKIIDGAGRGIIEGINAAKLLKIIKKIDESGHSGIYYSTFKTFKANNIPEWDYRDYSVKENNALLRGRIYGIREKYENCGDLSGCENK